MRFTLRCVQCMATSVFWADEENAMWAEIHIRYRGAVIRQWFGQQPASFFALGIQKLVDRWDKCLNKLGQYVEK